MIPHKEDLSMDDNKDQTKDKGRPGYETPGEDKIIKSKSDAVPSPSATSEQRLQPLDSFIGGRVNEPPGDANPALDETIGYEKGQTSTADLLRAREGAEERVPRSLGKEMYADQTTHKRVDVGLSGDPEEEIYERREFTESDESSEIDMLGLRGPELPSEEEDGH
jgi:hypothetical protein